MRQHWVSTASRQAGWLNIPVWLPSPSHWHTPYPSSRRRVQQRFACQLRGHAILQTLFTPHSAQPQCATALRNSVHSLRALAMIAHLDVTVTTFMLVRTGIPSTPTSSSSNQILSTRKQVRTLKQAALSSKQELWTVLSSKNTQHRFSSKTSQEQGQESWTIALR